MRNLGLVVFGVTLAAFSGISHAYEYFLPLGTGYSTEVDSIPVFDSKRATINQQADIIETEIYRADQAEAVSESRFNRFMSDAEVSGADTFIDY